MKLRKFRKSEDGAVAVFVAIALMVLLGSTALAVDYGAMSISHQSMQNAADAAALAGARELKSGSTAAINKAKEYCKKNGFDPDDEDVRCEIKTTKTSVTVTLQKDVRMSFAAVAFGENERSVSASATAATSSYFGNYPYALFAGDENGSGIVGWGTNVNFTGSIHSNEKIILPSANLKSCTVSAVKDMKLGYNQNDTKKGNSSAIDMPPFDPDDEIWNTDTWINPGSNPSLENLVKQAKGSRSLSDLKENGLFIYVKGNLQFNGGTFSADFPIVLIAEGNIQFNGTPRLGTTENPYILVSKTGNISFNGGEFFMTGIVYAPNGKVHLPGGNYSTIGSIIAKSIEFDGGGGTFGYSSDLDRVLPGNQVHLIA